MYHLLASLAHSLTKSGFLEKTSSVTSIQILATVLFVLAVLHTFCVSFFNKLSIRYEKKSIKYNFFHFLGEVETVFGVWAFLFVILGAYVGGWSSTKAYLVNEVNYTEALFIFVIMTIAATTPVVVFTEKTIAYISKINPFLSRPEAFFCTTLTVGPVLGSFITEPAAMTVIAFILLKNFFTDTTTLRFKYATLAILLVNVSIGGTLTNFAAPPVLMVATKWDWSILYMFLHFGWKSIIAILVNTTLVWFIFRKQIKNCSIQKKETGAKKEPWQIIFVHLLFLCGVVVFAHDIVLFMGLFIFFLGWYKISKQYQEPLHLQESLLVAFFLAGLVVLGGLQGWWIERVINSLTSEELFVGAAVLTGITDNAALTYLGTLVPNLSDMAKFALVAGAVAGGGLTVIANAPNPAGFNILKKAFGKDGISAKNLILAALAPTLIAMLCLWFLPSL